jgi:hypothetical protein
LAITEREKCIRQRLRADLQHYADKCLRIRTKSGAVEPLALNVAQEYIHERLEAQRAKTGRVRAFILKGRQQGCSTYVSARFYWKVTHSQGLRVFILTHEQQATDNLFGMANRYHEHCPPLMKPSTGAANAKELFFDKLDAGYEVGTAGTKAVGRSKTVQLFHGSEVAFWPNAATHFAGVVQAIPDLPGTEIILESTANGVGGEFHERWQQAEAGIGDYQAIFVPWFWQAEYSRPAPDDFAMDDEEWEYADAHGLDLDQMCWRRAKMAELKDPLLFKQEYPATAAEAFQLTGHDSFIKPESLLRARKAQLNEYGPLVIGADPAGDGATSDRFSLAWRAGPKVRKVESKQGLDNVAGANWIRQVIDEDRPARVFIDVGGLGAGVFHILRSWGEPYSSICVAVNFGSEPFNPNPKDKDGKPMAGPRNRRAEMWGLSRDWLDEVSGADIPDRDSIQADACAPKHHKDTNQRFILESKAAMKARGVRSPDEWDAVALTFAEPVSESVSTKRFEIPSFGAV